MNRLVTGLVCCFLVALPLGVSADPWADFASFSERFYHLDTQEFIGCTARVRVPLMEKLMAELQKQTEPMKKSLSLRVDLRKMSLIYRKGKGLEIIPPDFEISFIPGVKVKDPEQMKEGVKNIRSGFNQQVDGVTQTLVEVFRGLESPRKEDYTFRRFAWLGETASFAYTRTDGDCLATFTGKILDKVESGQGSKATSKEFYEPDKQGKLLMTKGSAAIETPMFTMDMDMEVGYQFIEKISFPTSITTTFSQKMDGMEQSGKVEIYLEDIRFLE